MKCSDIQIKSFTCGTFGAVKIPSNHLKRSTSIKWTVIGLSNSEQCDASLKTSNMQPGVGSLKEEDRSFLLLCFKTKGEIRWQSIHSPVVLGHQVLSVRKTKKKKQENLTHHRPNSELISPNSEPKCPNSELNSQWSKDDNQSSFPRPLLTGWFFALVWTTPHLSSDSIWNSGLHLGSVQSFWSRPKDWAWMSLGSASMLASDAKIPKHTVKPSVMLTGLFKWGWGLPILVNFDRGGLSVNPVFHQSLNVI